MPIILETGALAAITAADIVLRAHRILGNKGSGETLTADEKDDGLEALNALLDGLSIDRLMIYEMRQESFTWPASTVSRTIGSGGDFDTHRPDRIGEGTFFQDSNSIDYPVEIIRERSTYDSITDKTVTSTYPELLFYNPSVTLGTLYTYPISSQSLTLFLNQWQPLQIFDSLSETHNLPPGYRRMLYYNLAQELEADVGLPLPPNAARIAISSKKSVKRNNNLPIYGATETFHVMRNDRKTDIYAGK